jgi:hypothetical protein
MKYIDKTTIQMKIVTQIISLIFAEAQFIWGMQLGDERGDDFSWKRGRH